MEVNNSAAIELKENSLSADTIKEEKLRQACAEFEAILLQQMLKVMRNSVTKSELFDGGFQEEICQSMQDQEIAKQMAIGRGMGIGEYLYRQISGQHLSTIKKQA